MKSRFYDLQYIKAIPIADYLHACGIKPAKRYNGYALYHAPYREDPNASLKVDFRQNLWHDYGTGQGGSIIDLVMRMQGCSAYEAIKHLAGRRETIVAPSSFHREAHIESGRDEPRANNRRHILSISDELPSHLQRYLREVRKIDLAVASAYLRHIHYEVGGREYSAIGFPNRAGGYELRDDKTFKGTIAPKDITPIFTDRAEPVCIFEGFMDFLSFLSMKEEVTSVSLVMNSVSNVARAIRYLNDRHLTHIRAFLDNDEAGRRAVQDFIKAGFHVENMNIHYKDFKDLNGFHVSRVREQQKRKAQEQTHISITGQNKKSKQVKLKMK